MAGYNTFKMYTFVLQAERSTRSIPFSEFYQKFTNIQRYSQEAVFNEIAHHYLSSFQNQFMTNRHGTRGISVVDPRLLMANAKEQIIHGFVQGGPSDDSFAIYERNQTQAGSVNPTQILSQDYYFLIYFPRDINVGCIMLQYNSSISRGISSAFFEHLRDFFTSYQLRFIFNPYVPSQIQNEYKKNCIVTEVKVIEWKRTNEFNPKEGKVRKMRIKHSISGIKVPFSMCIQDYLRNGKRLSKSLTRLLGIEDEAELYDITLMCNVGKERKTFSIKRDQIYNNLIIDNSFIDDKKTKQSIIKMYECAEDYLSLFKEDIH